MQKKLTITVDERVYEGLYRVVGSRRISRFIEDLVRPHVVDENVSGRYESMAADEEREADAAEWSDAMLTDIGDEGR
jgi:predicted CopG family antitoxin